MSWHAECQTWQDQFVNCVQANPEFSRGLINASNGKQFLATNVNPCHRELMLFMNCLDKKAFGSSNNPPDPPGQSGQVAKQ